MFGRHLIVRVLLPLLALVGVTVAVVTVVSGDHAASIPAASPDAPESPYMDFVAGSGLVEAGTENIAIGTPISGIVTDLPVRVGSGVTTGQPLFTIDDRMARAEVASREAAVRVAEAELAETRYDLGLVERLAAQGVVSEDDLQKKRFADQTAETHVALAQAELASSREDLERRTVRAPVDGQVLQLKVHLGEYAEAAGTAQGQTPLLLLGSVTPLGLRVDVDENDAWRVRPSAPATGFLRARREIETPLEFVRFEPYIVPKHSLTGDSTERVDTRVLQVIYMFQRGDLPIFVGEQMDVYIDASAATSADESSP